jgi:hypothetical protein
MLRGLRPDAYFTGSVENEVIWQALKWCEKN